MTYDRYFDFDPAAGPSMPQFVFVDEDSITVFAGRRLLRADFEGTLRWGETHSGTPVAAASGSDNYAVLFDTSSPANPTEARFCMVGKDGGTDTSACPLFESRYRPGLAWDGTSYWMYGRIDDATMYMKTYDPTGAEVADTHLPSWWVGGRGGGTPFPVDDKIIMLSPAGRPGTGCDAAWLDEIPRTLDPTAHVQRDLLPADFTADTNWAEATSGRRTAWLYWAWCRLTPPWADPYYVPCQRNWPNTATLFLALVDGNGQTVEPAPRCIPSAGYRLTNMVWDGAQFAYLTQAGPRDLEVSTFDEDGNPLAWSARPSLISDQGPEILQARLAAVGPNDYIVVYTIQSTGAMWIARFSLVPL